MVRELPRPMLTRILVEIIVGMALGFFIMFLWYITQPIVITLIGRTMAIAENMGHNNTYLNTGIGILVFIEYWWGPIALLGIAILWMFISTQRKDWEGRIG